MRYILSLLILILIASGLYAALSNANKASFKQKRISCQQTTTTFERVYNQTKLYEAIKQLEATNYDIDIQIDYSKYMKNNLKDILNEKQAINKLHTVIKPFLKQENATKDKLLIDFYIYENDKEDKRKKGDKCKLYAGYVMLEFKYQGILIYKIQTDYMQNDISDMNERLTCAINSFISLK